jgi:LmbE family N-acetylglucosaminyl deacetylase
LAFRLMCVGAHPDDESGAFGGALLFAHAKGMETQVLCLTDGKAASNRGSAQSDEELEQMRHEELAHANAILGVTRCEQLNYPDGQLDRQDFYELTGVILQRIRQWRPQVVLTFGPEGGINLHRDHTAACLTTTAAFHWAGRSQFFPETGPAPYTPQKLYYSAPPTFFPGTIKSPARTPFSLSLKLGDMQDRKLKAFQAHRSQAPILQRGGEGIRERFAVEHYLLMAISGDQPFSINDDDDLFAGVKED